MSSTRLTVDPDPGTDLSLRILWAKSNISTRISETDISLGFLFLAHHHPQSLQMLDLLNDDSSLASPTKTQEEDTFTSDSLVTASSHLPANGDADAWEEVQPVKEVTTKPGKETLFLGFIAKKDLTKADLAVLREAAARTRIASTPPITLFEATSILLLPISHLQTITLDPILTLTPSGDSACLVRLTLLQDLPELWFERDEVGHDLDITEAITELRRWFQSIHKCLILPTSSLDATSPSSSTIVAPPLSAVSTRPPASPVPPTPTSDPQPIVYTIVPSGSSLSIASLSLEAVQGQPLTTATQKGEWPMALPISQSSLIYKFGAFGIGVAAAVVGPAISNKVEDITRHARGMPLNGFRETSRRTPLARPILPYIPQQIRGFIMTSQEAETLLNDYDSAGHYLAQWAGGFLGKKKTTSVVEVKEVDRTRDFEVLAVSRLLGEVIIELRNLLRAEEWIMMYDGEGKLSKSAEEVKLMIFFGGLEDDVRSTAWKYLLNVYPWDSTERIPVSTLRPRCNGKRFWRTRRRRRRSGRKVLEGFLDEEGEALAGDEKEDGDVVSKIKERRYRVEKDVVRTDRTVPFFAGTSGDDRPIHIPGPLSSGELAPTTPPAAFSRNLEMLKDVLITYTVYNFELGYVQGMNDLLAPVLAVMREGGRVLVFCGGDGDDDQSGMRRQLQLLELLIKFVDPPLYAHLERIDSINLFCCFRWLLVLFKREFEFDDIMRLWEVLWACPFTKQFHLFVALAILNRYRGEIMGECKAFDECLKFTNDLSGNLDLEDILGRAEVLFEVFRQMITIAAWERLGVNIELGLSRPDGALPTRSLSPVPTTRGRSASGSSVRSGGGSPARSPDGERDEVDVEGLWDC
ncbi:rab-GTPase-TBC domain-containing protein [Chytridium lagenaria]|nr:rab-GTPase-TBC domain-containing protein [Chytridium lagenaria]